MTGVRFEITDGVGLMTLTRPDVANAIDLPTAHELGAAVDAARSDDVRVVLLQGEGARFCAGGDVRAMAVSDDRAA